MEQTIAELRVKTAGQEASILREREFSNSLRARMEEEGSSRQSIRDMDAKLEALLEKTAEKERQEQQQGKATAELNAKSVFLPWVLSPY